MTDMIYCSQCKSSGKNNRCYITGYDSKCGHSLGMAYSCFKSGSIILECTHCGQNGNHKCNKCYITGYDIKCGHDNGWAYLPSNNNATCYSCSKALSGKWSMETNESNNSYFGSTTGRYLGISDGYFLYGGNPNWVYSYCKPCWIKEIEKVLPSLGIMKKEIQENQPNATCNSCGKTLNGKWIMESNSSNNNYFSWTTGRYLGISDGYFLYGGNPNWVYSYCKPCWIKEIEKILPSLGLAPKNQENLISEYKNKTSELQNIINSKENEIRQLKKEIEEKNIKLKEKENEINQIKKKNINIEEETKNLNLNSAPPNLNNNNYENIISQCLTELEVEKINELLKSSEIKAISDLNSSLTSNIISLKALTDFKSICKTIIKNNIKDILEKIDKNIDELKTSINNINSIHNDVKDKLSNKDIPGDVFNESINPLNKYLEGKKKKMENLEKIKSEINKIYLKINNC